MRAVVERERRRIEEMEELRVRSGGTPSGGYSWSATRSSGSTWAHLRTTCSSSGRHTLARLKHRNGLCMTRPHTAQLGLLCSKTSKVLT